MGVSKCLAFQPSDGRPSVQKDFQVVGRIGTWQSQHSKMNKMRSKTRYIKAQSKDVESVNHNYFHSDTCVGLPRLSQFDL